MRRAIAAILLFAGVMSCAMARGHSDGTHERPGPRDVTETVAASAGAMVVVTGVSGAIDVVGWERDEVAVSGTIGADTPGLSVGTDPETG